ncbi:hypothetical protein JTE90_003617 [Oedothorax gibbosus]|uniref:C2 domain-containing protein n=1 Tax=Oedothorax gibbosus TaxID=931172 RepID=A0AAV6VCE2_9ARAC|nr:hypothetical protein JTE90_003617 [Oedothorax gibbosus]
MASRSRPRPERKKRNPNQFPELGLFDIPDLDNMEDGDDSEVDESMLESELEALMSGGAPSRPKKPKPKAKPALNIEALAAECLKDSDGEDEDDGNLSNDEDLLNELKGLTTGEPEEMEIQETPPEQPQPSQSNGSSVDILQERLSMYQEAIQAAKEAGDTSKVRRYGRAVKTIESLLKSANAGAAINEEDIPPVVKMPKAPPPLPARTTSVQPLIDLNDPSNDEIKTEVAQPAAMEATDEGSLLRIRRDQYKKAALIAKRSGNQELAIQHLRTVKTLNNVIEAMENNLPVDLSQMPPPPEGLPDIGLAASNAGHERVAHNEVQTSSNTDMEKAALAAAEGAEPTEIFDAPPPPTTVLEALEQRLQKYASTKQAAEAEGNSGKVRRLDRIIKQYQKAIKDHKAGKAVDFEELPAPPGFGPIPVEGAKPTRSPPKPPEQSNVPKTSPRPQQNPAAASNEPKKPKLQRANTSTNKQLDYLLERQKLFRQAALEAKKNGDIQQAKEYLRMSKGFDSMIEATKCGLPIDATSIPTPPQLESSDFVIVDYSECNEDQSQEELYESLEKDLKHQIEVCTRNKEHFLRLGDVSSASKFEKLCLDSKKDLAVVLHLKKKGEPAPRFHYETRLFSMVQCHTDLGDNDIEVRVERGINLPGKPDDLDSYVKIEFPIPAETPQRAKTHTIRDTNNPIYQEEFKFEFQRKSRSQLRHFKRGLIKCEVWSKGGFLRSDTHLGTASIKLCELESKCLVHDSFNLMDGRKACGGKLEVKVRVRDPLFGKQVEEVRERWLVVGS